MMTTKKTSMRAPLTTEALERLTADDFVRLKLTDDEMARLREINKAREQERLASVARIRAEAAPLFAELQTAGLKIQSVGDLIAVAERYEAAIPVLLKHLQMPYSDVFRETIARSLAVPEAEVRKAWPMLVEEYRKAPIGWGIKGPGDTKEFRLGAKDGLACALSVAVTDETLEELIAIAKDPKQGKSRVLLLSALKKRRDKNPLAKQAIAELANDPDLKDEIASWRKR
ncbi:hypothetical protein [Bradyrhizobium sp. JYMT SZCCT0180]|uniref:hypothetical protein n=1 Tax=Bradyrhizobium sp. JYMT SZCCT0180 TaxID=2807666 RepID=UPI001BAD8CB1|nr:hypothetical protein [Bradyrhizobium sp. JYMT SZCCT0180]MBR1211812.1 hypothetical protein [Bradyrhizobium sp. JYMT SZCCT0180]